MSDKFRQEGKVLSFTTAGAVASGAVVRTAEMVGVANKSAAASGEVIPVSIEGVFVLPKSTAAAFVQGDLLDFNVTDGVFLKTATPASGKTHVRGVAFAAAAAAQAATVAEVKLHNPGSVSTTTA
jgi:predicted RecA/RadA family phage recombinase